MMDGHEVLVRAGLLHGPTPFGISFDRLLTGFRSPDAELQMKVGTVSVTVKQRTDSLSENQRPMLELSVGGLVGVGNARSLLSHFQVASSASELATVIAVRDEKNEGRTSVVGCRGRTQTRHLYRSKGDDHETCLLQKKVDLGVMNNAMAALTAVTRATLDVPVVMQRQVPVIQTVRRRRRSR